MGKWFHKDHYSSSIAAVIDRATRGDEPDDRRLVEQDSAVGNLAAANKDYIAAKEDELKQIDSQLRDPDTSNDEKRELRKQKTTLQRDIRNRKNDQREMQRSLKQSEKEAERQAAEAEVEERTATRTLIESVW